MDVRRLRTGEWLMAVAGAALVVAPLLAWSGGDPGQTGWQALSVTDVLLALVGTAAIGAVPVVVAGRVATTGLMYESLVLLAAIVAAVLCLIGLLGAPADAAAGACLATVAALGLCAACLIAMRDERLSDPARPTDSTGAPAAPPAPIETLAAPPA